MEHENYQRQLELLLARLGGRRPRLLLHACCAPCSSYVLEALTPYFDITVDYYNPNIDPEEEYHKRMEEQKELIRKMEVLHPVSFLEGAYDTERFYQMARGMEDLPEGQERCFGCYELRLREAAEAARQRKADYFTTTLSISPMKNAEKLNEIGERIAREYGIRYLTSDFKKRNGYRRSVELSGEYGLYRQDYCGCVFSKREREQKKGTILQDGKDDNRGKRG